MKNFCKGYMCGAIIAVGYSIDFNNNKNIIKENDIHENR